ncbi:MAG: DUF881 domain-containing protein [Chloroflexota bacterium]
MTAAVRRLRSTPSWQITLGVALLALGFLIAAQVAAEPPRVRYTSQERPPLVETAQGLQQQQEALKAQILDLRASIHDLEQRGQGSAELIRQLNAELETTRIAAGLIPLRGSGIVLQLEDSQQPVGQGGNDLDYRVGARDLRTVLEELWQAGAEAIAINGERITPTTAVIDIGGTVLVNSAYQAPPYQVSALGPADLYKRLSASAGWADFIRARSQAYGLRVSFAEPEAVDIPAFAGTVTLRYSRPAPSGSPTPSPSP